MKKFGIYVIFNFSVGKAAMNECPAHLKILQTVLPALAVPSLTKSQTRNEYLRHSSWFPNCLSKNKKVALKLSQDEGRAKFAENLRSSPFSEQLSNEITFSVIHLASN
jgi:hypothetical protein